jgi:hypothetical protein
MDKMSLLREALRQLSKEERGNWLRTVEQELNRRGMGDIWRREGENKTVHGEKLANGV